MRTNISSVYICTCFLILLISISYSSGKGFGGGRFGGGFRGGSRSGSSGSKLSGGISRSSIFSRGSSAPKGLSSGGGIRKSSNFKKNAALIGGGVLAGAAGYAIMSNMASSYRTRSTSNYGDYGTGATCVNNDDFNGTKFGEFRCPLPGFSPRAKSCCGDYGEQYCCESDGSGSRGFLFVILLGIAVGLAVVVWMIVQKLKRSQSRTAVPTDAKDDEEVESPSPNYRPDPPSTGYPPVPSDTYYVNVSLAGNAAGNSSHQSTEINRQGDGVKSTNNENMLKEGTDPPSYAESFQNVKK